MNFGNERIVIEEDVLKEMPLNSLQEVKKITSTILESLNNNKSIAVFRSSFKVALISNLFQLHQRKDKEAIENFLLSVNAIIGEKS